MNEIFEITPYLPVLLQGLKETLSLALASALLGFIFSIILMMLYIQKHHWIKKTVFFLVNFLQGIPEILILFSFYFGGSFLISAILNKPTEVNTFLAGTLTLASIFALFASKVFYTAFCQITSGEKEAAKVLGLSTMQSFFHIILPNLWLKSLPELESLWLTLLKDTVIISLIGGKDLFSQTQIMVQNTGKPFTFYLLVSVIFIILSFSTNVLFKLGKKPNV